MGAPRTSLPLVRLVRDGHDDLELQVLNPDLLRWDTTRSKHRWPAMRDAPHLWLTFVTWAAATRTGATADAWEPFSASVLEVATIETDDQDTEDGIGAPFLEDPEPDS